MAYPKGDSDYRIFIIKKVIDDGNGWFKITSTDGLDCTPVHKDWLNGLILKPGLKYRAYAWMGIGRGLYISGHVIRQYKTKKESHAWVKEHLRKSMAHRRKNKKNVNQ
ncbi:MAG: hypothetical protein ACI9H6_000471 [Patiriisocius sp.]|jgi:hypothetical protein